MHKLTTIRSVPKLPGKVAIASLIGQAETILRVLRLAEGGDEEALPGLLMLPWIEKREVAGRTVPVLVLGASGEIEDMKNPDSSRQEEKKIEVTEERYLEMQREMQQRGIATAPRPRRSAILDEDDEEDDE